MFDYFKNCSSSAHDVFCEDKPTKGPLYNLCLVWWPCPSFKVTNASQTWHIFNMHYNCNISNNIWSCGIQTWYGSRLMHVIYIYVHAHFDDLDLDTKSQWIGRGKQYLCYGIQTVHDGRLMYDIHIYMLMLLITLTLSLTLKMFVRLVLVFV